jgi:hypothetical protein
MLFIAPVYKQGGLSQSQLCDHFSINGSNLARKARKAGQTSQEYLEKQTGWRYEKSDRKYYPTQEDLP